MERSKPNLAVFAVLFLSGIGSLLQFSHHVRAVDVVGLSGGGAACGAGIFGVIAALKARKRT
jgi:hypothetical protein